MSQSSSKSHWKSPMLSIPLPSNQIQPLFKGGIAIDSGIRHGDNVDLHDGQQKGYSPKQTSDEIPLQSINIPHNALYGMILGRSGQISGGRCDDVHFECRISRGDIDERKLDKLTRALPLHCGCIFRATFENPTIDNEPRKNIKNNNDSSSSKSERKTYSINLPLTSQSIDPKDSNIFDTDSDEKIFKVITSTKIARIFYIQKGTNVQIECVNICKEKSCNKAWEWGLVLHQLNGFDSSNISHGNKLRFPDTKRVCLAGDGTNNVNPVDFFPDGARKKPLLCTTCRKKFPTAIAIFKHFITSHIDSIGASHYQEIENMIGPNVLRQPLQAPYEDDDLVVVVKHQGLAVQGDKWTLMRSDLLMQFKLSKKHGGDNALSKPRPVHRLDSATGGLLVVAKTYSSEASLKRCFASRSCRKRYRAILFGRLEANGHDTIDSLPKLNMTVKDSLGIGVISTPISGKESITYFSIVSYSHSLHKETNGWMTTVDLYPVTGRKHQLRKHCKLLGHPIWGDKRYGPYQTPKEEYKIQTNETDDCIQQRLAFDPHTKLCLWALEIIFPHPVHGQDINIKIEEPEWYEQIRKYEEDAWKHSSHSA